MRLSRCLGDPRLQLGSAAILETVAEITLKLAAQSTPAHRAGGGVLGFTALGSPWAWLSIACYVLSNTSWLAVLRNMPVSTAFAMMSVVQVLVPIGCWLILGEAISSGRAAGILFVFCGVALAASTVASAEERL